MRGSTALRRLDLGGNPVGAAAAAALMRELRRVHAPYIYLSIYIYIYI